MLETALDPSANSHAAALPLPAPPPLPRLRVPMALVVLYWSAFLIVGAIDKLYFFSFMYAMISAGLLVLAYFTWWWLNRRIPLRERAVGFLLLAGGGALIEPLCHETVGVWGIFMMGLPVAVTTWTVWLLLSRKWTPGQRRLSALLVVGLTWGAFTLLRVDVPQGNLHPVLYPRWVPSAEESFLAERDAGPAPSRQKPATDWRPTVGPRDWQQFRGPERDGVVREARIRTDWGKSSPPLVWKKKLGPAWSSVIVVNGRLFTQEQRGDQECVVCYDAKSGHEIWVHEDAARFKGPPSGIGPRATPSFAGGVIVTLGGTGILNCLDAVTGKRHWMRDVKIDAHASVPQWGFSGSPLLVDGLAIVFAGSEGEGGTSLLAYRRADGSLAWSAAAGALSYSSPQLVTIGGQRHCLMASDAGLTAVDPADGKLLWKTGTEWPKTPRALVPQKVGNQQILMGGLEGASVTLLDLKRSESSWNVSRRYTSSKLQPEFPDMVVHDGHAYGFDVTLFCCLDLENGQRRWKDGRYGRGQVLLLPDQALLLVISEEGEVILLAANPHHHEELGRFQALGEAGQKNPTWNHPVIADNRLYVRNAEEMACYDLNAIDTAPPARVSP